MRSDVCLILEGSYPYVVGGVSTWTHHMIKALPELTFSIVYVGVSKHHVQRMEYRLPENVNQFHEVYLLDPVIVKSARRGAAKRAAWKELEGFVTQVEAGDISGFDRVAELLTGGGVGPITPHDILYSKRFWEITLGIYRRHFSNLSFIDFFWTVRFLMLPLFQLLYTDIPEANVYHASCTGYAGLLGALAKKRTGSPLLLTEHGIYTTERMIEISQADYIYNEVVVDFIPRAELGLLQQLWLGKFEILSQIAYRESDTIVTLFEGNRQVQIQQGADPAKCVLVPNGIEVARYAGLSELRPERAGGDFHIAYVGRISPIKDVKTYIRAARIVLDKLPNVTFYLLGTPDEDVDYYEECRSLVELLDLRERVLFMGNVDMGEYYPMVDLVVLTSVSEAQPFVVIEAMVVGVPVVATNVGACADLLFGGNEEDRRLGAAGLVTNVNSPDETASAILNLLGDSGRRRAMAQTGRERAFRYYQRQSVINRYRELYRGMGNGDGEDPTIEVPDPTADLGATPS